MTMKRLLRLGISFLVLIAFGFLFAAVENARSERICKELEVKVDHSHGVHFLYPRDIREFLQDREDSLLGSPIGTIALNELESDLDRIPQVKNAEAYHELDGTLQVDIRQRRPIARFLGEEGTSYYWDQEGERLPLSKAYTARVPVVTGHVDDPIFKEGTEGQKGERFFDLLKGIQNDPFWSKQIQELHVDDGGGIELVPLVGDHRVILGGLEDRKKKLNKLEVFYRKASQHTGLGQYDTLDLRFEEQVIGKKKEHGGS